MKSTIAASALESFAVSLEQPPEIDVTFDERKTFKAALAESAVRVDKHTSSDLLRRSSRASPDAVDQVAEIETVHPIDRPKARELKLHDRAAWNSLFRGSDEAIASPDASCPQVQASAQPQIFQKYGQLGEPGELPLGGRASASVEDPKSGTLSYTPAAEQKSRRHR